MKTSFSSHFGVTGIKYFYCYCYNGTMFEKYFYKIKQYLLYKNNFKKPTILVLWPENFVST